MSHKSQLFPSSGYETPTGRIIGRPWEPAPANVREIRVLQPWIDYDFKVRPGLARCVKWNSVLGLALATVVSVSIWAGIALAIARIWR